MRRTSTLWMRDVVAAAALGAAIAAVVAIARAPYTGLGGGASSASLVQGAQYLAELRARSQKPSGSLAPDALRIEALQATYLVRIETGLGSPFRAIEAALRDPWLPDSVRPALASAMLASALAVVPTAAGAFATDAFHAALVDSIVRAHPEPRRGEEIVRVAFDLAAASGAISQADASTAAELAAVARDAVHTRRDIARLVAAAHKEGLAAIDLVPMWRQERRFDVERPIVYSIAWAATRELVWNAARVFELLDARANVQPEPAATDVPGQHALTVSYTVRNSALQVARARNAPPVPAVVHAMAALPSGRTLFAATEEELAAAWLNAKYLAPLERRVSARAMLAAAVRLRTTAQDPVWFAGDDGPRVSDLHERYGLRAVTFASGLRPAWREYALHSIDHALTDARRVLPDLDLRGLRVHVGLKAEWPTRAMALHDPETRTIYFPLGTAPGVLAHELGHDLDWQVARSVFGEQGIYATDGTARRASEILAAPVERLTGALAGGGARAATRQTHSTRPTEVLARHVDWIMAAALAAMGRSNGFLSTVQEGGDALGNTSTPNVGQIDAAVSVLSSATRVPDRTVQQVHARTSATPLVREVLHSALATTLRMPWNRRAVSPFEAVSAAPTTFRQAADPRLARRCVAAFARAAGEPDWVGDVHALAADARSRDVIRRLQQGSMRRPLARDGALARVGLNAGPVDPLLRAQSVALLRREIEWQLAAAMVTPLAQASQAGGLRCDSR